MNYTANNYDCVGFVLKHLGISFKPKVLPILWWQKENLLIFSMPDFIKNSGLKIKAIIYSQEKLLPGDICFMKIRGKYIHHLAIYQGDGHVLHNLPGRGVALDLLRKNNHFFKFGVRLWLK